MQKLGPSASLIGAVRAVWLGLLVWVCSAQAASPESPRCAAATAAPQDGFFVLDVGDDRIGLPTGAAALRRPAEPAFAGVVVTTAMKAQAGSGSPLPSHGAWLPAAASQSGSALVRRDVPLTVENADVNLGAVAVVLHAPPGASARPVAALVVDRSRWRATRVSLREFALPQSGSQDPALSAARLEHLYTLAFRQDADARYCLPSANGTCDDDRLLSQGEALQQLAERRECALAALPEGARAASPAWRVVTLQPAPAAQDPKSVAVRLLDQAVPIAGAQVLFSKLPHASCTATSQADGTASCVLTDNHGHAGGHPEFDREPVVVTFPGDLRSRRILLPTTRLMPSEAGGPPSFLAP